MTALSADPEQSFLIAALQRVAGGDKLAFRELYRRTCARLLGVCLRVTADRQEAEDVLQEVYVTVWQKAAMFDPARASPITWLAALARNRAIDRLRANGRRITTPIEGISEPADESAGALEQLLEAESDHDITACIEELVKTDAVLVRTAFFQQATYAELATRSGMPLGTVKSRIRRALIKLKACLS
ncbi:sigma-70 family RNA polymerase sigma factor [Novosphingobium sp. NDB2Meth1]|uniref:sigma-70 family RNA polymerase sigma factor n=1 Tax=Novosphingobium sp. NDB2Meth1 TaxID=1892847 RepID=UPI0009316FDF|nr:sigma-70 family RNA polymerase sigma factor [Novosphingobium sp. NDB2Meth1]